MRLAPSEAFARQLRHTLCRAFLSSVRAAAIATQGDAKRQVRIGEELLQGEAHELLAAEPQLVCKPGSALRAHDFPALLDVAQVRLRDAEPLCQLAL